MATRDELIWALSLRYSEARRIERSRILDEFVAVTGYHRKHAMRVLRGGSTGSRHGSRPRRLIENFFAKLKQFRAIATRYDKRAINFLAGIYLASIVIWLNCKRFSDPTALTS
jgi:hypothetical protein